MAGKPTGRFSNGKVPPDLIVEELGIIELLPAYLDPLHLKSRKLAADLSSLGNKLPNSRLVYVDIHNLPLDVINNPQKYGFMVADKGFCGTGKIEVAELCTFACSADSDYVFLR
ncbi:hypothetical protein HAX54_018477 [Datura stramonium]|uniref:Uncharacterized protein n=1 Tax=Datura stramonium TaxID=4076 RepID=A0ABS8UP29_DATST|nr:hypothetical protein [Datura stramonium]